MMFVCLLLEVLGLRIGLMYNRRAGENRHYLSLSSYKRFLHNNQHSLMRHALRSNQCDQLKKIGINTKFGTNSGHLLKCPEFGTFARIRDVLGTLHAHMLLKIVYDKLRFREEN